MKKIFLMALFAIVAVGANAQFYLGGSLNVGTQSIKVNDGDSYNTTTFALTPELGYNITPVFAVGTELGFGYAKTEDHDAINTWTVAPYFRFNFAELGRNVKLFADAVFEYDWISQGSVDTDGFLVGIRPGISVALNSHWNIIGKTMLFSYSKYDEVKTTTFAIQPSKVSLGFVYNF